MPNNYAHSARDTLRTALIETRHRVFSGFLNVDEARVRHTRHDGSTQTVVRLSVERGDSAAIALVDRRRRVIYLSEQFRFPTLESGPGWLRELPAGEVERGETMVQAAIRETFEETGFTVNDLEPIAQCYLSPGGSSERMALFYAVVDGLEPDAAGAAAAQDPHEDIALLETPLDDFLSDCREGRMLDAKTLLAGLWLLAHRERLGL